MATDKTRPRAPYERPAVITPEQIAVVLLTTLVACYLFDWYGLLTGFAMTVLLVASNANLRMMISDIEQEEREEGSR